MICIAQHKIRHIIVWSRHIWTYGNLNLESTMSFFFVQKAPCLKVVLCCAPRNLLYFKYICSKYKTIILIKSVNKLILYIRNFTIFLCCTIQCKKSNYMCNWNVVGKKPICVSLQNSFNHHEVFYHFKMKVLYGVHVMCWILQSKFCFIITPIDSNYYMFLHMV